MGAEGVPPFDDRPRVSGVGVPAHSGAAPLTAAPRPTFADRHRLNGRTKAREPSCATALTRSRSAASSGIRSR
jgi:hypothetical protein